MENQPGPTVDTGIFSVLGAAWMGGQSAGEWTLMRA